MFKSSSELGDVVSHAIFCTDDNSFLLTLEPNSNEYWIPSSQVDYGNSWSFQSLKELEDIFGLKVKWQFFTWYKQFQRLVDHDTGVRDLFRKVLRLYKIWTPICTTSNIYHCIYMVRINAEIKKKIKTNAGKYRGKLRWVQEAELNKMLIQDNLRSPEIVEFFNLCKNNLQSILKEGIDDFFPSEFSCCGNVIEVTDCVLVTSSNNNLYGQIVESASFTKEVQVALFKEFTFLCYPATYMSQQLFSRFLLQFGWSKEDTQHVFKAADLLCRYGLSFRDFIYILAAIEPTTSHGGTSAEIRCRYIFKFYDRDKDNKLNLNEFKTLIAAIRKSKNQPIDPNSTAQDAETNFKNMGLSVDTSVITLVDFLKAVGDLKLRGTSQIFRSETSVLQYLQNINRETQKNQQKVNKVDKSRLKLDTRLVALKSEEYELGEHSIILQKSGTMISIDEIWNVGNAVSSSSTQQNTLADSYKRLSIDQFSQTSITNELLKCLRYLTQMNKGKPMVKNPKTAKQEPYSWGELNSQVYAKNFITICSQVQDIFKSEPRLLEISAPTYIMGDLHGNLASLLYFEKVLWRLGPGLCPCNLLFLGDYVDRGPYSIEVISYLFCYKMQTPGKLFLLRGNHEIREIQKMFTFHAECINKFGEKNGLEVWNAVNTAFDFMPLAALLDGKIFCCHGGIPPPWLCPTVASINSIPCPLSQPDEQSTLAWEIMWNDPINLSKTKKTTDEIMLELLTNDGFAVNSRRGTAHVFSVEALERFLKTNGLSHIIRAHEVAQAGFNVLQKGKLLTVFSSAKYCGGINDAACVLADQKKLRVLRLDTS